MGKLVALVSPTTVVTLVDNKDMKLRNCYKFSSFRMDDVVDDDARNVEE